MSELRHVVTNHIFLLGLDHLYRETIRRHEAAELLDCARDVAAMLDVPPADVPIEGYYTEDPLLTEYFRLMRGLQKVGRDRRSEVEQDPAFQRLLAVTSSPLYGEPAPEAGLLPVGRDALSKALDQLPMTDWTLDALTDAAHALSVLTDEFSLTGLAARVKDRTALAAFRESGVLYFEVVVGSALFPPKPEYVWAVDDELTRLGTKFVETFNALFGEDLPQPGPPSAREFWNAADENNILGRCVRVGYDDSTTPNRQYHWAICRDTEGEIRVHDFWDDGIWTTERFRERIGPRQACP